MVAATDTRPLRMDGDGQRPCGYAARGLLRPGDDGHGSSGGRLQRRAEARSLHRCQRASATLERIAWEPDVVGSGTVEAEAHTPRRHSGPHRRLHRPGRLGAPVPEGCRRDGGCGEPHAELGGGIPAVAERRPADVSHSGGRVVSDAFESSLELIAGPTCSHALPEPHLEPPPGRFLSRKSPPCSKTASGWGL